MKFIFTYPGNGRETGRVCDAEHTYSPPEEPGRVGTWRGPGCWHNATDGYASADPHRDIERRTLRNEHAEIGHREPVAGCPWCEVAP